jgi:hypothetical protein
MGCIVKAKAVGFRFIGPAPWSATVAQSFAAGNLWLPRLANELGRAFEGETRCETGAGSCPCETKDDHGKKRGHEKMRKGNNGFGNGGHDGVPGKSGKQDKTR